MEELMLVHSRAVLYLLNKLQDVVAGGLLQVTALVALFYAAVPRHGRRRRLSATTLGRDADGLRHRDSDPFEVRMSGFHPGAVAIIILAANCFIVWFLYRVLRREATRGKQWPRPEEPACRGNPLGVRPFGRISKCSVRRRFLRAAGR
jgi:hypothetical protein